MTNEEMTEEELERLMEMAEPTDCLELYLDNWKEETDDTTEKQVY